MPLELPAVIESVPEVDVYRPAAAVPSDAAYATLMSFPDTAPSDTVIVAVPAARDRHVSVVSDGQHRRQ